MRLETLGAALILSTLWLGACGEETSSSPGSGSAPTVELESPADGAKVTAPFEVELSSSEPLGPTDSGEHHVHLLYDGKQEPYYVVEGSTFEVTELPPGKHTIVASLRNADHSSAGATDEIAVTVQAGGDTTEGDNENDGGNGGYNY